MKSGMMKGFVLVLVIGFLSIFALSCGGSSSGDDGDGGGTQSLSVTGASGNQVNLNGTWGSGCDADIEDGESGRSVLTISESSFTQIENEWLGSTTCSEPSDLTANMSGTVVLGGESTVTYAGSNVTATELDVVISSFVGTVNNIDTASAFNAEKVCGFDSWEVGIPKDILGTDCSPDSDFKDLIYIDDTADPDVMYAGDEDGPVDANGYPTEIDTGSAKERM